MRSLILASGAGIAATWLLLYVNELRTGTVSLSGAVVYFVALLCPSACFWIFLWAGGKFSGQGKSDGLLFLSWTVVALVAICSGIALTLLSRPPGQRSVPLLFSGLTAIYACSVALAVATFIRFPSVKQQILHGNLLGRLAVGGALGGVLGFWLAKVLAGKAASTLGGVSSLLLDAWCLVAMLLSFLCLLSVNRVQRILGVAAIFSLALLFVFSRFEVFFSIWLVGSLFWPFVVLCTLAAEAVAFRALLSRFFSRVVGV